MIVGFCLFAGFAFICVLLLVCLCLGRLLYFCVEFTYFGCLDLQFPCTCCLCMLVIRLPVWLFACALNLLLPCWFCFGLGLGVRLCFVLFSDSTDCLVLGIVVCDLIW